jgi:hypothetical protein
MVPEVIAFAREHMRPDPHADPERGFTYKISSLYFDTDDLDVFHRQGSHKRRKYRLRKYGDGDLMFAEIKSKSRNRVSKLRTTVTGDELGRFGEGTSPRDWQARWFHRRILANRLRPVSVVSYERAAFFAELPEGPARLTIDQQVRCSLASGALIGHGADIRSLLAESPILELKFQVSMPALFKRLVYAFALQPAAVSKYRQSVESLGIAKLNGEFTNAATA